MTELYDIEGVFRRNASMVYRLCYSYLHTSHDAEDATQSVFMKLLDSPREFESIEHEKAWLIVCASNLCKDMLKNAARKNDPLPEEIPDKNAAEMMDETLQVVMGLPADYRDCVYLHYYEGYRSDEIAGMTGVAASTVRNRLSEARKMLKPLLKGE